MKKMIRIVASMILVMVLGMAAAAPVSAQALASKEEAKALVEKAAEFLRANGKDLAIAEFNNPKGQFTDLSRDRYIVAANLSDGVRLAHGANARMIGKSLVDFKDVEGKAYGLEILDLAKSVGGGWVDYKFSQPSTKKIANKSSYVLRIDDLVIFAGAYVK